MNKTELIDQVASDAGLTKAQAGEAVAAVLNAIQNALKGDDSVVLVGFGTFSVVERASRTGRNPRTGQIITIPEVRMPRFKPGKSMRDAVERVKEVAPPPPPAPAAPVKAAAKTDASKSAKAAAPAPVTTPAPTPAPAPPAKAATASKSKAKKA